MATTENKTGISAIVEMLGGIVAMLSGSSYDGNGMQNIVETIRETETDLEEYASDRFRKAAKNSGLELEKRSTLARDLKGNVFLRVRLAEPGKVDTILSVIGKAFPSSVCKIADGNMDGTAREIHVRFHGAFVRK